MSGAQKILLHPFYGTTLMSLIVLSPLNNATLVVNIMPVRDLMWTQNGYFNIGQSDVDGAIVSLGCGKYAWSDGCLLYTSDAADE